MSHHIAKRAAGWLVVAVSLAVPVRAQPPAPDQPVSQEQVLSARRRALAAMLKHRKPDGTWPTRHDRHQPGGDEVLAALAVLSAEQSVETAPWQATLAEVVQLEPETVYVRALRAVLLSRLGPRYAEQLAADVAWLVAQQQPGGGWGYGPSHPVTVAKPGYADNAHSHLAVWALTSAELAGVDAGPAAWAKIQRYWLGAQNPDGGWGYQPPDDRGPRLLGGSYGTMTAAGTRVLWHLADRYARSHEQPESLAANPVARPLLAGLDWVRAYYSVQAVPEWAGGKPQLYHYLHNLMRLADRAGMRTIASHELADDVLARLIETQDADGLWSDPDEGDSDLGDRLRRTGWALLAMRRAACPVAFGCLNTAPGAVLPPQPADRLAAHLGRSVNQAVRWVVLTPDAPADAYAQPAVLYVRWSGPLPTQASRRLAEAVAAGQVVLVQPEAGRDDLRAQALGELKRLSRDISPGRPWRDHPVQSTLHKGLSVPFTALAGPGGDQVFVLHEDIESFWTMARAGSPEGRQAFAFADNLVLFAAAGELPPTRLPARTQPVRLPDAVGQIRVAWVRHNAAWQRGRGALDSLRSVMRRSVSVDIQQADPVDLAGPVRDAVVLWMTGEGAASLSAGTRRNLARFVRAGGTVLIEPADGDGAFHRATMEMLRETFGPAAVGPLAGDHPLLTGALAGGAGADVREVTLRNATGEALRVAPPLMAVRVGGRVGVVISSAGVSGPMTDRTGAAGLVFSPSDARRVAANIVLYALTDR